MSELTFADLRVHYGTGRAYTISGKGRDRVTGYRVGMMCNLGDIEVTQWCEMVRNLIVQTGEQELHQQLITHMKEHYFVKQSKAEFEQQALELHAARIFDNQLWVDFIPFNKRFRPEVLRAVKLIPVMPECCKKVGYLTDARYRERDPYCDENFCPHCGRWTKISLVDIKKKKETTIMISKKKRIEIYGTLEHPLQKGCAAFIKESGGTRRTSAVQHFITVPSGTVYIETKNTHYVLKPPAAAPKGVCV